MGVAFILRCAIPYHWVLVGKQLCVFVLAFIFSPHKKSPNENLIDSTAQHKTLEFFGCDCAPLVRPKFSSSLMILRTPLLDT
jgi:hypothetical protein